MYVLNDEDFAKFVNEVLTTDAIKNVEDRTEIKSDIAYLLGDYFGCILEGVEKDPEKQKEGFLFFKRDYEELPVGEPCIFDKYDPDSDEAKGLEE